MEGNRVYQVKDLAGCQVRTDQNEILGKLVDVLPSGSNDIYVVRDGEKEILVPALKSVVKAIDLEKKEIVVQLPNGLKELNP